MYPFSLLTTSKNIQILSFLLTFLTLFERTILHPPSQMQPSQSNTEPSPSLVMKKLWKQGEILDMAKAVSVFKSWGKEKMWGHIIKPDMCKHKIEKKVLIKKISWDCGGGVTIMSKIGSPGSYCISQLPHTVSQQSRNDIDNIWHPRLINNLPAFLLMQVKWVSDRVAGIELENIWKFGDGA